MDEVLKAVTGVNWRRLGKELIGEEEEEEDLDIIDDNLDPKHGNAYTNLDRIHDEHESDEARLRAVVKEFFH